MRNGTRPQSTLDNWPKATTQPSREAGRYRLRSISRNCRPTQRGDKPVRDPRSWEISRMASWLLKAFVQRSIAALPNPHYWNELLQERVTHTLELTDGRFDCSLSNCRNHLEQFRRYGSTARGNFSAFELGTGWFAVVPIGLFLSGAREVWTWDIAPLLKLNRLKLTIVRFLELD